MQTLIVKTMRMLFKFLMLFQFLHELLSLILKFYWVEILCLHLVVVLVIVNFLQVQSSRDETWFIQLFCGSDVLGIQRMVYLLMTKVNNLIDLFGGKLFALASTFTKGHSWNLFQLGSLRECRSVFTFDKLFYLLGSLTIALAIRTFNCHILRQ